MQATPIFGCLTGIFSLSDVSKRILIVSNTAWSVSNFRLGLIKRLLRDGCSVMVAAPRDDSSVKLVEAGCEVVDIKLDNKGMNPVRDAGALLQLIRLYRNLAPSLVLHYTIKPVIYGGVAARSLKIPYISTITGLGTVFIKEGWVTRLVEWLYRISQKRAARIFFQNSDDRLLFQRRRLVPEQATELVPGSGIDVGYFALNRYPSNGRAVRFLLIARMLRDKGVVEYVEAARIVKQRYPETRFQLLGEAGAENQTAIHLEEIEQWVDAGYVEYLGTTDDVRGYITQADCVVLPSYREGMPRTLLEAASMGRPIVTTDVPGCREVVSDGVNGYLCKVKSAESLADSIKRMLSASETEREQMGLRGRELVLSRFDVRIVVNQYMAVIR